MRLPFFTANKDKSEYYLALLLLDEKASAVILESTDEKVKVINSHEEFFPGSVEDIEPEEFIKIIDKAISTAEETLPPNIETHKTVFGVKESWIEDETKKIKKEYLANLKKMCNALNLSPIGFMVTSEAITHLMQEEEGAPLSAIFVELGKSYVNVAIYRGGKVAEKLTGELEGSAPAAVNKLLQHFTLPVLPARIILFHSEKGEKLSQQFISHQWSKSLPFLHMPQITILPEGFDARAVTFGAATQMGFEVLELEKPAMPTDYTPNEAKEDVVEKKVEDEEEQENEDGSASSPQAKHLDHEELELETDFGFVINEDVSKIKPPTHAIAKATEHHGKIASHHAHTDAEIAMAEEVDEEEHKEKSRHKASSSFSLGSIGMLLMAPIKNLKLPKIGNFQPKGGLVKLLIPLVVLVVIFLGLTYVYFYQTKATVTLTLKPKMVQQTNKVIFSTTSSNDFSKNILSAKTTSATVDTQLSKDATGKKDVGEKAKGTVTIYNNAEGKAELSSDTAVKSSNGLVFLLAKDVTIASASGDIFSGTKPGTVQVSVVAKEIGTSSNLPSGTKFAVEGNSNLAAKNDSAFSGGSKKSVTVVSKEDLAKLKADLPQTVKDKAVDLLSQKATADESLLPIFLDTNLEKTKFDKNLNDEAKKVTLKGTVAFTGIIYQNKDLQEYAKSLLKTKYSQNISFAENSVKGDIKETKTKSDKEIETTVLITAGLLPTIDVGDVKQKLHGKSPTQAKEMASDLPQVIQTQITFSPNISFLSSLFPSLPNNVEVVVKSE